MADKEEDGQEGHREREPADPRKKRRAIIIGGVVAAIILLTGGAYGAYYLHTGRYLIETDDAYTQADAVIMAAQVSGTVETLLVTDNQPVKRGQVLAQIDRRIYQAALEQAQSDFVSASVNVANAAAQIALQTAVIKQADTQIESAEAGLASTASKSQTAAPGYGMYYAWVIRHLPNNPYGIPDFTDEHKWVMEKNAAFWFPEELKDGK
jgi:membrane fusion protein (multidrug efflux system)